jgi:hypothetical protein
LIRGFRPLSWSIRMAWGFRSSQRIHARMSASRALTGLWAPRRSILVVSSPNHRSSPAGTSSIRAGSARDPSRHAYACYAASKSRPDLRRFRHRYQPLCGRDERAGHLLALPARWASRCRMSGEPASPARCTGPQPADADRSAVSISAVLTPCRVLASARKAASHPRASSDHSASVPRKVTRC